MLEIINEIIRLFTNLNQIFQTIILVLIGYIFVLGLFSIVLHYAFTYIGLSLTDSSKTALLKQLGVLLYICFAFLFVRDEKFNKLKIAGLVAAGVAMVAVAVIVILSLK